MVYTHTHTIIHQQAKEEISCDQMQKNITHTNPAPAHDKSSRGTKNRGECSQVEKEHLQKLAANIVLNSETLNAFPLRLEQGDVVHFHQPFAK